MTVNFIFKNKRSRNILSKNRIYRNFNRNRFYNH